jgi:hypothetical protein
VVIWDLTAAPSIAIALTHAAQRMLTYSVFLFWVELLIFLVGSIKEKLTMLKEICEMEIDQNTLESLKDILARISNLKMFFNNVFELEILLCLSLFFINATFEMHSFIELLSKRPSLAILILLELLPIVVQFVLFGKAFDDVIVCVSSKIYFFTS